jgi:hypothetical protein
MAFNAPDPISVGESRRRRSRVLRLARSIGFVGQVEYRHVYSQTGGAQYGRGAETTSDLLTVYAEAFERDTDLEDFSLEAIVAHERGHQLLARHPKFVRRLVQGSQVAEEVLASLLGALVLGPGRDCDALIAKATADLLASGVDTVEAIRLVDELWDLLERLL